MKKSAGWILACGLLSLGMSLLSGCASKGLSAERRQVVEAGLSQIGTPYAYGGSQPGRALDCSGLTQYAHHTAGVRIPRVSTEQRRAARPVRGAKPLPGDILFFETSPGVQHVGLMVDSERFVHASTSQRRVLLSRFDAPYWQSRFLGAGTYLK